MEFDLSHAGRTSNWDYPIGRAILFFVGLGFPVIYLATDVAGNWKDHVDLDTTIVLLLLAPLVLYLAVYKAGSPPNRLVVDEGGVSFRYPSGRMIVLSWSDPKFSLRFVDARFTAYNRDHPGKQLFQVRFQPGVRPFPDGPITPKSYEFLASAAVAKGLVISPSDWNVPTGGTRNVVIRAPSRGT
jgi:hypothetical protein